MECAVRCAVRTISIVCPVCKIHTARTTLAQQYEKAKLEWQSQMINSIFLLNNQQSIEPRQMNWINLLVDCVNRLIDCIILLINGTNRLMKRIIRLGSGWGQSGPGTGLPCRREQGPLWCANGTKRGQKQAEPTRSRYQRLCGQTLTRVPG